MKTQSKGLADISPNMSQRSLPVFSYKIYLPAKDESPNSKGVEEYQIDFFDRNRNGRLDGRDSVMLSNEKQAVLHRVSAGGGLNVRHYLACLGLEKIIEPPPSQNAPSLKIDISYTDLTFYLSALNMVAASFEYSEIPQETFVDKALLHGATMGLKLNRGQVLEVARKRNLSKQLARSNKPPPPNTP